MQRVTVIPVDKVIIVDGLGLNFDFSAPAEMHALQWQGEKGWIEFTDGRMNCDIVSYEAEVAPFVVLWAAEKARLDEEMRQLEAERNRPPTLEEARTAKLAEIIAESNKMSQVIKGKYSQLEIDSWQQQEAEARALLGDANSASTSAALVMDLAANDGVSPLEFAKRIVANAEAAATAAKSIILQQQAMEKLVKAAQSVEAVQAVSVNYTA